MKSRAGREEKELWDFREVGQTSQGWKVGGQNMGTLGISRKLWGYPVLLFQALVLEQYEEEKEGHTCLPQACESQAQPTMK
jgi:hypothetical protein